MNHKIYTLILASSFALFLGACSESSSSPDCEEDCMEEMSSSGEECDIIFVKGMSKMTDCEIGVQ